MIRREPPSAAWITVSLALVLVVLAAIGFGIAALESGDGSSGSQGAPDASDCHLAPGAPAVRVGPAAGTDLASYIQTRRAQLARCADAAPDDLAIAVVSFAGSANPVGAAALVGQVSALASYVSILGADPLRLPVGTPAPLGANQAPPIVAGYAALATQLQHRAQTQPATASTDRAQVAALQQSCGCVYALTVTPPLRTLATLARNKAIRLVDIAPVGAERDTITARPILPGETGALSATGTPTLFGGAP